MTKQYWRMLADSMNYNLQFIQEQKKNEVKVITEKLHEVQRLAAQYQDALAVADERRKGDIEELETEVGELTRLVRSREEEIIRLKGSDTQTNELIFANEQVLQGNAELKEKVRQAVNALKDCARVNPAEGTRQALEILNA